MSFAVAAGIAPRIRQVLEDKLPAELALVDAGLNDGITTPAIPTQNIFDYELESGLPHPAITLRLSAVRWLKVDPDGFGRRLDFQVRGLLKIHVGALSASDGAREIQRWLFAYVAAVAGVLFIMYEGLQTTADPNRYAGPGGTITVKPLDDTDLGPVDPAQSGGSVMRTATIGLEVRRIEARG